MSTSLSLPEVCFYIPKEKFHTEYWPSNAQEYWQWQCSQHTVSAMQGGGLIGTFQTYLHLKDSGFPCRLVDSLPERGIIISHRDFLDETIKPKPKQLFVCLRADVDRHPYAQLHVVQNPYQAIPRKLMTLWESYFIPHWPQPDIISRDPGRNDTFENITFIGNAVNLVPEFKDKKWHESLKELGLTFNTRLTHDEWNDYHDTDVILAIRGFGCDNGFRTKPASKLYNAWHADIPAILGYETAFRAERKSDLDYLEATSYQEVLDALKRLHADKNLRLAMVENGRKRAKETQAEIMVEKWKFFIIEAALPAYRHWCATPRWQQNIFFTVRKVFLSFRPTYYFIKSRLLKLIS